MKASLNWLREFVEIPVEPRDLKADLTGVGLNVESFATTGEDCVLDIEVTTNRPDCLSHLGVARELSALYQKRLRLPPTAVKESGSPATSAVSIEIADPELCGRYCGRVIQNIEVKPSPPWLAKRLEAVGMRPINNAADVTNFVLMEFGHPLHAFDLARLRQNRIIVRRARSGERLRTLDGVERGLKHDDLVIADAERAVALAGVMGGADSEISAATRSLLLESAWFDPVVVRRTAKSQGMHTEASHRFERGADIEMARMAIDRAARLIAELAGGEVLPGVVDVYPQARRRQPLPLRASEILRILGAEIPAPEVERILGALSFELRRQGKEGWQVTPPSFRLDVSREVDLIEEVARHYGYARLPARLRPAPPRVERDSRREKELALSSLLVSLGYREIITRSMVDPEENSRFTDRPPVVLANPLSQDESVLRSTPVPSMLRALRWNLDRDHVDLCLFEVGKTYTARPQGLPEERRVLTLALTGHRRAHGVHERGKEADFFDLKGDLETIFEAFDLPHLRFESVGCNYYEAAWAGRFALNGETLAILGCLAPARARDYKLHQAVWLAEMDLDRLFKFDLKRRTFRPYSKFPSVERDFSLLVPKEVPYAHVAEAVQGLGLEEIQSVRPVERLPVGQILAGYYTLLLRIVFQSGARTLTSEEIAKASQRLLAAVEPLGVRLRG